MTDQSTGRRTFFHQRGTNALLGPEHFDFSRTQAKIFHLGYLLLLDRLDAFDAEGITGAAAVLRAARATGMRTSLDCVSDSSDRFRAVATPALPHVDYFFANDFEAGRLTGIDVNDCDGRDLTSLRRAGKLLLETGVHRWVFIGARKCGNPASASPKCGSRGPPVPATPSPRESFMGCTKNGLCPTVCGSE